MSNVKRLVALGLPPVLAKEICNQIDGGGGGQITTAQIADATDIGRKVLTSADRDAVRNAIGAGTSSLQLGMSGSTAMPGDHKASTEEVSRALAYKPEIRALTSPEEDFADLAKATGAIKSIIDALQAEWEEK